MPREACAEHASSQQHSRRTPAVEGALECSLENVLLTVHGLSGHEFPGASHSLQMPGKETQLRTSRTEELPSDPVDRHQRTFSRDSGYLATRTDNLGPSRKRRHNPRGYSGHDIHSSPPTQSCPFRRNQCQLE